MTDGIVAIVVLVVCFGTLFGIAALLDSRTKGERPEGMSPVTSMALLFVAAEMVLIALSVYFRTLTFVWIGGGLLLATLIYRRVSFIVDIVKRVLK